MSTSNLIRVPHIDLETKDPIALNLALRIVIRGLSGEDLNRLNNTKIEGVYFYMTYLGHMLVYIHDTKRLNSFEIVNRRDPQGDRLFKALTKHVLKLFRKHKTKVLNEMLRVFEK